MGVMVELLTKYASAAPEENVNRNFLYLVAIWMVFLLHGTYYCYLIPLWEGFDEWGHYAFIEHLRLHSGALPRTTNGVSEEIRQSVQSAPIRHEATDPMMLFEAQQPPLYYWTLSIPNRMWIATDISTRLRRLRIFSVFIASLAIPFGYLAAWELFYSRRMALTVCALITAMPALMIDIARIGNESLGVGLGSILIWLLLRSNVVQASTRAVALGVALGLGLLTKAYFLIFIPILILRRRIYSLLIAIAIAGWWYWRNLRLTGTWTGEIMDVAATKLGWYAKLAAVGHVHWIRVLDVAMWTHIWTGGWSFFTLRSWMYRVFELIFAIVAIAIVSALARRPWARCKHKLAMLALLELLFAAAIAYQALSIFMAKNIFFAPGWYFYALVVAEALLLASGVLILVGRKKVFWAMFSLIGLYTVMDVYSAVFILARHYRN